MLPIIRPAVLWGSRCWKSSGRLKLGATISPSLCPSRYHGSQPSFSALRSSKSSHVFCFAGACRLLTPSVGHGERTFLSSLQAAFCKEAREQSQDSSDSLFLSVERISAAQCSPSPTWHRHQNHHTDEQGAYARLRGRNINLQKSGTVGKGCQLGCSSFPGLLGKIGQGFPR